MQPTHFPSLDLCKNLTEIGFPETELYYETDDGSTEHKVKFQRIITRGCRGGFATFNFVCPSVMEMLDVMPYKIDKGEISYYLTIFGKNGVQYQPDNFHAFSQPLIDIRKELPSALAEMILWLHEKNYISFTK